MLYQRLPAAVVQLPTWFKGSQATMLRADMDAIRAARRS
jgi:hypothetical protein